MHNLDRASKGGSDECLNLAISRKIRPTDHLTAILGAGGGAEAMKSDLSRLFFVL